MQVSIITINYNNKTGLEKTIKSVVNQTYLDYEYIIIDGNSTDGSKEVIEAYKNDFSYWVSEGDSGIYNAMNKGIKASRGKYLLFLNSGDILRSNAILEEVSYNLQSDKDIYYGNLELVFEEKREVKIYPDELSFSFFVDKGHIPHPASFIKRQLFDKVYLYKEYFKIVSDWDFFVCAICKHNASYSHLNKVTTSFEVNGISASSENTKVIAAERQQSIEENFPLLVDDIKRLVDYDKKFKLNRFKMLSVLESNTLAKKMNSLWLTILTKVFNKPYK